MSTTYSTPTFSSPFIHRDRDGDELDIAPLDGETATAAVETEDGDIVYVPKADVARVALALLESAGVDRHADGALSRATNTLFLKVRNDERRARLEAQKAEEERRKAAQDAELDALADKLRVAATGLPSSSVLPWASVSPGAKARWREAARVAKRSLSEDAKKEDASPRYFVGLTPSGAYAVMDRQERKAAPFGASSWSKRSAEGYAARLNNGEPVGLLWDASRYTDRPAA